MDGYYEHERRNPYTHGLSEEIAARLTDVTEEWQLNGLRYNSVDDYNMELHDVSFQAIDLAYERMNDYAS